jgi:prepilin-type N-terminal cleavage/methylation domain-containing protein
MSPRWRNQPGFTLVEGLIVVILIGIAIGIALPTVGSTLASMKVQRAATVVASDLRLGPSIAARQRLPVTLDLNTAARRYTLTDRTSGTVMVTRDLSLGEYSISSMASSSTAITFFPGGLASDDLRVVILTGGHQRVITMNRAGQVRIQ